MQIQEIIIFALHAAGVRPTKKSNHFCGWPQATKTYLAD
jgi:hypothetical protein